MTQETLGKFLFMFVENNKQGIVEELIDSFMTTLQQDRVKKQNALLKEWGVMIPVVCNTLILKIWKIFELSLVTMLWDQRTLVVIN